MAKVPITVMGFRCDRCQHEWVPRDYSKEPAVCPKCKSPYWNRPKGPMTTYEQFRDAIHDALEQAGGDLTWTDIRTRAKLPQKFPNNAWVHRLEEDIGLKRTRDAQGIVQWSLG